MTSLPNPSVWRLAYSDIGHFFAFGGGIGYLPQAPGTAGTLLAVPLYYAMSTLFDSSAFLIAVAVACLLAGVPICARAAKALQQHDDRRIVWDEVAAFFLVLACLPPALSAWWWQVVAFVLFRIADIAKPFPISWLDKNVGGGVGIMVDDIAAAALTIAVMWLFG